MRLLSHFSPKAPWILAYMLQQFEYNPFKFVRWAATLPNLFLVQKRGRLHLTARGKLMVIIAYAASLLALFKVVFLSLWLNSLWIWLGISLIPIFVVLVLFGTTWMLQVLIVNPKQTSEIRTAKDKLSKHSAVRIAVLGSYGKTTMKELLVTVLSETKKVAATPGNKNVLISHARWVNNDVKGDEDVLVFEYGEAEPGDIAKLANFSQPDTVVVTGIAPAHMDTYPSLDAIAKDFACIAETVKPEQIYLNDTKLLRDSIKGRAYSESGLGEWDVSDVKVAFEGTKFTLNNGHDKLQLGTRLLGAHLIGPLTAVISIAKQLGLSNDQIKAAVARTRPYEHRMQPRLLGGAWIIDDTYNGNIEGMRAGLELLKALPAKRKIYVTPGLVDQGTETQNVHTELGQLIAAARPDRVVLMRNSATSHIQKGLQQGNYSGEIVLEANPLQYYTNLEHFLAAGDVVMLQNDWPDSYR